MEMMMHQKYTAKSMMAPRGGAPGMVLRTAGRAKSTVTAPVTTDATSTYNHTQDEDVKARYELEVAMWISIMALCTDRVCSTQSGVRLPSNYMQYCVKHCTFFNPL
jgi:hypothetical protein